MSKTIVIKVGKTWELIMVKDARVFTGKDHNMKAVKYYDKKVKEKNDN